MSYEAKYDKLSVSITEEVFGIVACLIEITLLETCNKTIVKRIINLLRKSKKEKGSMVINKSRLSVLPCAPDKQKIVGGCRRGSSVHRKNFVQLNRNAHNQVLGDLTEFHF